MNIGLRGNKIIGYELSNKNIKLKMDNSKVIEIPKQDSYINLINNIIKTQEKNLNIEKINKIIAQQSTNKTSILVMFILLILSMIILTISKNIVSSIIMIISLILLMVSILKYLYNKQELKIIEKAIRNSEINKNREIEQLFIEEEIEIET